MRRNRSGTWRSADPIASAPTILAAQTFGRALPAFNFEDHIAAHDASADDADALRAGLARGDCDGQLAAGHLGRIGRMAERVSVEDLRSALAVGILQDHVKCDTSRSTGTYFDRCDDSPPRQ